MIKAGAVPYCGTPPMPDLLWARWNFDPILLAALVAVACLYWVGTARLGRTAGAGVRGMYFAGLAVTAAALISPLCALSVSLFSARVGQHMVLALLAAPLVAAGRPAEAFAAALRVGVGRWTARPGYATAMFAAVMWFWHAPAPYAATFRSVSVYWAMHISTFGARRLAMVDAARSCGGCAGPDPGRPLLHRADGSSRCADHIGAAAAVCAARADDNRLGLIALARPAAWRRDHVDPRLRRLPDRRDVAARPPAGGRAAAAGAVVTWLRRGLVAPLALLPTPAERGDAAVVPDCGSDRRPPGCSR